MSEILLAPERATRRCSESVKCAHNDSRREPRSSNIKAAITSYHPEFVSHINHTIRSTSSSPQSSVFIIFLLLPNTLSLRYPTNFKMQYFTVVSALLASVALSSPVEVQERQLYIPCSGLYGTAQCCATDVLGVADLNCADPPTVPTNASDFQAECSAIGQQARCCVLPIVRIPPWSGLSCANTNNTS